MSKPTIECAVPRLEGSTKPLSRDWALFSERLTSVLSRLEENQYLIVSAKISNRFVQFACQGALGMRVEITSNHFLKGEDRLNGEQISWLRSHGWNAPTGDATEATPKKDPDGSPNYYIDFPAPLAFGEIAQIAVHALVYSFEVPHTSLIVYEAFDGNREMLSFEDLGLKPAIRQVENLMERVLEVFREVTGIASLKQDEDGEIAIVYASIVVRAILLQNRVRLFSGLLADIEESLPLLRKLNEFNIGPYGVRCVLHQNTVIAGFDLLANPFVPEHLAEEVQEFAEVAEGLAQELRTHFIGGSPAGMTSISNYLQ